MKRASVLVAILFSCAPSPSSSASFRDTVTATARNDLPCPRGDIYMQWSLRVVVADGCGVRVAYALEEAPTAGLSPDERVLVLKSRVAHVR